MSMVPYHRAESTLKTLGFEIRLSGGHAHFIHPNGAVVTIPSNRPLGQAMVSAITRQVVGYGLASDARIKSMLGLIAD